MNAPGPDDLRPPMQNPEDSGLSDELVGDEQPDDDLFARVALHNKLISQDDVDRCGKIIAAEVAAGERKRALVNVLISEGLISPKAAGAIEVALRKQRSSTRVVRKAEKRSEIPPKPEPLRKKAPAGDSQVVVAVDGEAKPDSREEDSGAEDKRLKLAVEKISPGRIYPEMLRFVARQGQSVLDPAEIAEGIGESQDEVVTALNHWLAVGVLRRVGTGPYNFSPMKDVQEDLKILSEAWADPRQHAKVMGFILAVEQ
jgi:hypothetical protein